MPRTVLSDITHWVTEAAVQYPLGLAAYLAERRGTGRASARAFLHKLAGAELAAPGGQPQSPSA